jgi:hypothetical protein
MLFEQNLGSAERKELIFKKEDLVFVERKKVIPDKQKVGYAQRN